jgi:hypothetical protein
MAKIIKGDVYRADILWSTDEETVKLEPQFIEATTFEEALKEIHVHLEGARNFTIIRIEHAQLCAVFQAINQGII